MTKRLIRSSVVINAFARFIYLCYHSTSQDLTEALEMQDLAIVANVVCAQRCTCHKLMDSSE